MNIKTEEIPQPFRKAFENSKLDSKTIRMASSEPVGTPPVSGQNRLSTMLLFLFALDLL